MNITFADAGQTRPATVSVKTRKKNTNLVAATFSEGFRTAV